MSISEKIEAINNKTEQNKTQFDLDWQTAKISALSSGNVTKHAFLTGKNVLPEKDSLEKAAALKIFEYSALLGNELKKQAIVTEKQYQKLDKVFESDIILKSCAKSNLVCNKGFKIYK